MQRNKRTQVANIMMRPEEGPLPSVGRVALSRTRMLKKFLDLNLKPKL